MVTRSCTILSRISEYSRLFWELGFHIRRVLQAGRKTAGEQRNSGKVADQSGLSRPAAAHRRSRPSPLNPSLLHLFPPSSLTLFPDSTLLPA